MFSPSRLMHGSFKRGRADKQQSRCKDDCLPGALPSYTVFHAHATCTLSKPRTRWRAPETTHNDDEKGVKGNIGASREARRVFLALGNTIEEFKHKSLQSLQLNPTCVANTRRYITKADLVDLAETSTCEGMNVPCPEPPSAFRRRRGHLTRLGEETNVWQSPSVELRGILLTT